MRRTSHRKHRRDGMRGAVGFTRAAAVQVTGGSNLSYGIRSLYQKTFAAFDTWLASGGKVVPDTKKPQRTPKKGEKGDGNGAAQPSAGAEQASNPGAPAAADAADKPEPAADAAPMDTDEQVQQQQQGAGKAAASGKKRKASNDKADTVAKVCRWPCSLARMLRPQCATAALTAGC